MEYLKFETHCHTGDVSACGRVPAAEMVALYKAAGYSGLCITDHINPFTFGPELDTWEKKSRYFLQGYRNAKAAAGDDFDVLLGGEFHFPENNNDYLVYGMTEEQRIAKLRYCAEDMTEAEKDQLVNWILTLDELKAL